MNYRDTWEDSAVNSHFNGGSSSVVIPINKYQGQKGCAPRLYDFEYSCYLNLNSGRKFKKTGLILALHARDAIKKVKDIYDCYNVKAKPSLNGKTASSNTEETICH